MSDRRMTARGHVSQAAVPDRDHGLGSVLVTGATGRVGSVITAELSHRGHSVRAAVRRLGRQSASWPRFTTEVEFDFDRPSTIEAALDGVDRVFLIARPGDEEADRAARPLVAAMQRRHVRHVVNLTAMGVEALPDTGLRKVECAIEDSGVGFTHLRPNFFMQVFTAEPLLSAIRLRHVLAVPAGEARLSFVDARDVALVASVALSEPGHVGRAYTLTGGKAISHHEVAEVIAIASGVPVRYVPIDDGVARRVIVDSGLSESRATRLLGFYAHVREGHCSPVSGDIERVLGCPATTFTAFARDHREAWAPAPLVGT